MKTMRTLMPALAIGSVLLLGACGGGSGSSSSSATTAAPAAAPTDNGSDTTNSSDPTNGQGGGNNLNDPAVQQCLAEKGVTVPSFPAGGRGQRNGETGAGQAPPDSTANPEGGQGGGQGGFAGMDAATRQALQDCGVTFGRGGQGSGGGFGGAFNDPAVQQCLADKGITLPQGSPEQPPSAEATRPTIDPATRQAIQDCRAQTTTTTTG